MSGSVPVSEVIESLQAQVEELKCIAYEYLSIKDVDQAESRTTISDLSIQKELTEMKSKYAKAEYRIQMLCRALDEKDKKAKKLSVFTVTLLQALWSGLNEKLGSCKLLDKLRSPQ